jgi:hypothetical protein
VIEWHIWRERKPFSVLFHLIIPYNLQTARLDCLFSFTTSHLTRTMPTLPSNGMPPAIAGLAWCEACRAYHPDEPISSRTRARTRPANLESCRFVPQLVRPPSAVPVPEALEVDESDDSEDSDYANTDSDSSSTDSENEDESVNQAEVKRLGSPLNTWERIDLEDHVPLDIVRAQFPETRPRRYSGIEFLCTDCGKPVHDDDWLGPNAPNFAATQRSGDYCELCSRLKPDFGFRAEFCNCRCRCEDLVREVIQELDDLYGSDEEPHSFR